MNKIEQMIELAEKEKARAERKKSEEQNKEEAKFIPPHPFSFKIYKAINPKHVTIIWVFFLMISIAGVIAGLMEDFHPYIQFTFYAMLGLAIAWYLYIKVWLLLSYWTYKNWINKLPFTLQGWEELVTSENFTNSEYWTHCKIQITLKKENIAEGAVRAMDAASFLFCKEAAGEFYESKMGGDSRKEWTTAPVLNGSINCGVAGKLYVFFKGPVSEIQEQFNCIVNITIKTEGAFSLSKMDDMGLT